jgi:hypothetical protein
MGTRASQEIAMLWEAQDKYCAVCGREMTEGLKFDETCGWTIEHVYNHASRRYYADGNKLVSHASCNNAKGDREPTGCEIILLHAVNAKLGLELIEYPHGYDDGITGPSALALELMAA